MNGAPGRSRTCGLRNRNPSLYPAELRVQNVVGPARAISETVRFQHINFLQLKLPRFLCLKFSIDLSSLHERQLIPAGCKGGAPEFAARLPV